MMGHEGYVKILSSVSPWFGNTRESALGTSKMGEEGWGHKASGELEVT